MKKLVFKNAVLNIVLGIILIGFAVYATFFSNIMEDAITYVFAALIVLYASLWFYRDVTVHKNNTVRTVLAVEYLIMLLLVVLLIATDFFTLTLTLGLTLYLRGAFFFLINQIRRKSPIIEKFVVNLILLTLGAFVMFSEQAFESELRYVIFAIIIAYGLILLFTGIITIAEKKKQTSKEQPTFKENNKNVSEPKKATYTYTKEALMNKQVSELREMCKTRDIKGYSTMRKEQLVEKLWLYERDNK